jgi:hypothetical protein
MNDETIYERIKEDIRRTAERALTDYGNDFERMSTDMETALNVVLTVMRERIYK